MLWGIALLRSTSFSVTGGGGGGSSYNFPERHGGDAGSGVVIVKENAVVTASGCWDLRQVYRQVKSGDWA